ncbi:MAG: hypothetical protein ACJ73S_03480 [Mycobacteriales bacterium]
MSNVFYGAWLVRRGSLGWATHVAWFQEVPITATIQLSSFSIQEPEAFSAFQPRYAMAYIVTVNTPTIVVGGVTIPNPNKETDNNVWLTTDHVTFQLQAENVSSASAFGLIHDRSSSMRKADVVRSMDFAIYDDDGTVIGTHREVQLYGGSELDAQEIQERALVQANASSDRSLAIVPVDLADIPVGAFRIDPRTRQPVPEGEST